VPDDRRRHGPGRRESDRILDALWRELDALQTGLRRDLERLERQVDRLEEHVEERVDALESFHIQERTKDNLAVVEQTDRLGRWTKVGIAFGIVGVLWGAIATVIHL
jgi:hypothetical protein